MALKLSVAARQDRDYKQNVTRAAAAEPVANVEILFAVGLTQTQQALALRQALASVEENNVAAVAAP